MRVLLVHKFFRRVGGAEVILSETGRLLQEAGHQVAFLSTEHPDNWESQYSKYFVRSHDYEGGGPYERLRALATAMYSLSARRSTTRLIEDFRPDVAHMMAIFSHLSTSVIDACADAHVPVVMQINDYKHICPNYKLYHHGRLCEDCKGGRFYNAVLNRCCHDSLAFSGASMLEAYAETIRGSLRNRVDLFLFPSRFMADKTSEFWGAETFRSWMLHHPFTTPPVIDVEHGEYVLFFGRLVEEKGAEQVLRAAAFMPEIPVRIVGNGPCESALRKQAADAGLRNVEFLGPVWGEEMDVLLQGARVVVAPSMWYENWPYVIVQAFAAGKPVVGADRGGIPEMLGDGARGILYPADEPAMLAAAVQRIWADTMLWERMGRAGRDFIAAELGGENFMRSLIGAYEEVLGPHSAATAQSEP
jgi:glycosyltransferase involved in cell wall biosynthesis